MFRLSSCSYFFACLAFVMGIFIVSTPQVANAKKSPKNLKNKPDFSSVKLGPLKIKHRDVGRDENTTDDNVAHPGVIGGEHFLLLGRRAIGFGGSTGDFGLQIPLATFDNILGKKKGKLKIVNALFLEPDFDSDNLPADYVRIRVDYRKSKDGNITTADLKENSRGSVYATGNVTFRQISKKSKSEIDDFGREKKTRTLRYLFNVKGKVKDLILRKPDAPIKEIESARVKGKFLITIIDKVTVL